MASLKVAVMVVVGATPVAPLAGDLAVMVGAVTSAVVNDQPVFVMVLPELSCAPLTVAV